MPPPARQRQQPPLSSGTHVVSQVCLRRPRTSLVGSRALAWWFGRERHRGAPEAILAFMQVLSDFSQVVVNVCRVTLPRSTRLFDNRVLEALRVATHGVNAFPVSSHCLESVGMGQRLPDACRNSDGDKAFLRVEVVLAAFVHDPHILVGFGSGSSRMAYILCSSTEEAEYPLLSTQTTNCTLVCRESVIFNPDRAFASFRGDQYRLLRPNALPLAG